MSISLTYTRPSFWQLWLVPIFLSALMGYTWAKFLYDPFIPGWQNYLALLGYIVVIIYCFIRPALSIVITSIFLALAILHLFELLPGISYSSIRISVISIPLGQLSAWPLFILHVWMNFNRLSDYYLDYKERKDARIKKESTDRQK